MWRDTGSANTQRGDRGGLSEKHLSARTGERPQEVPNVGFTLDFLSPNCDNITVCCLSHSVCGIL